MKKCSVCQIEKPAEDFNKDAKRRDGLQTKCRVCSSKLSRDNYLKNCQDIRQRNRLHRKQLQEMLRDFKMGCKCALCPESEPCCLEFHHLDPDGKDFEIGRVASMGYSWDRILEEIAKCACVCSNCHRKLHAGKIQLP